MLKSRQKLGKYRIVRKIAEGGFAAVYEATDTIEGVRVALKVPHPRMVTPALLKTFQREVRLIARLDHPNILALKDASIIDDLFVIVFPLGTQTLADRLNKRLSLERILDYAGQLLEATAYAHRQKIIHCDIKPENVIVFDSAEGAAGNAERLRLTDFGIAKVAQKTIRGSGTGTAGYMAPEQAMGRPSARSDIFSLGVILFRMLTGVWAEWPYEWPLEGSAVLERKAHYDLTNLIRRALEVDPRKRYLDADQMLRAFRPAARRTLRQAGERRQRRAA